MMRPCVAILMPGVMLTAQQAWVVNHAPGAVADFTDIPAAVAAAAPGDTIHVVYTSALDPPYTAPTIDKPLKLVGLAGVPSGGQGPNWTYMDGLLRITGIAAGEQVLVSNFVVQYSYATMAPWGLEVSDCAGDVLLEDGNWFWGPTANYSLRIVNSANVTLRGCEMYYAGSPLEVSGSNVLLTTVRLEPGIHPFFPYPSSTVALDLFDSTATVIGSIMRGHPTTSVLQHQPAVRLQHSTLRAGPGALIEGGGSGNWLAYEIVPGSPSVIEQDPRGTISIIPTTQGTQQPVITEIDATFHSWVVQNRDFAVTVAGPTGGFALLLLGEMVAPTPTPFGDLSMFPGTVFAVGFEPMAAPFASHEWLVHCPAAAPVATGLVLQALTLSPTGQLCLTVPSPLTIAWQPGTWP